MTFRDHFSIHAREYARYRPRYPRELFEYLASLCETCDTAWDCATGNGQAAIALTRHFELVIATDASAAQISHAIDHPQVDYRVVPAHDSDIFEHSIDLVTVAQAIHWFDLDKFYAEVQRVLKPGGILAFWGYSLCHSSPEIDACIRRFYNDVIHDYWPPERRFIEEHYSSFTVPFPEIQPPDFPMTAEWKLADYISYLKTWSAVQRYISKNGNDPVDILAKELEMLWGDPKQSKTVTFPMFVRVARVG